MTQVINALVIVGLVLFIFAVGGWWAAREEEEKQKQQAKKEATQVSDYERKCRFIFSDNAEWGYILQGQKEKEQQKLLPESENSLKNNNDIVA